MRLKYKYKNGDKRGNPKEGNVPLAGSPSLEPEEHTHISIKLPLVKNKFITDLNVQPKKIYRSRNMNIRQVPTS